MNNCNFSTDEWLPPAYANCTNAAIPITIAAAACIGGILVFGLLPCIGATICCAIMANLCCCCCKKNRPARVEPQLVRTDPGYAMVDYPRDYHDEGRREENEESKFDLFFKCCCFCLICFFKSMAEDK